MTVKEKRLGVGSGEEEKEEEADENSSGEFDAEKSMIESSSWRFLAIGEGLKQEAMV